MEIGKALREAREARHLSLEEAEDKLKIRSRYLKALEEENFDILPERVYARGFLKTYTQFLGLDTENILQEFAALEEEKVPEEAPKASASYEQTFSLPSRKNLFGIIIGGLVIIILIWWIIVGLSVSKQEQQAELPNTEVTEDIPEAQPQPETQPEQKEEEVTPPPAPAYDGLKLTLTARSYDCWILVTTDGQKVLETILSDGDSQSFTAKDSIKVQAGYGKALQVTLNDQDLGTFSQTDVASREFSLKDLNQN